MLNKNDVNLADMKGLGGGAGGLTGIWQPANMLSSEMNGTHYHGDEVALLNRPQPASPCSPVYLSGFLKGQ